MNRPASPPQFKAQCAHPEKSLWKFSFLTFCTVCVNRSTGNGVFQPECKYTGPKNSFYNSVVLLFINPVRRFYSSGGFHRIYHYIFMKSIANGSGQVLSRFGEYYVALKLCKHFVFNAPAMFYVNRSISNGIFQPVPCINTRTRSIRSIIPGYFFLLTPFTLQPRFLPHSVHPASPTWADRTTFGQIKIHHDTQTRREKQMRQCRLPTPGDRLRYLRWTDGREWWTRDPTIE